MTWTFDSFSGEIHDQDGNLIATLELMQLRHGELMASAPRLHDALARRQAEDYQELVDKATTEPTEPAKESPGELWDLLNP